MTLGVAFHILQNISELDGLKNDAALKLFRITTAIEDSIKAERKAVEKAQKDNDTQELDRLSNLDVEAEFEPLTEKDLKEHGLLTAKILRQFSPIIDV